MEKNQITIDKDGSLMTFITESHKDYMILARYVTNDVPTIWIPDYINGVPVREIGSDCFFNHPEIADIIFSRNCNNKLNT